MPKLYLYALIGSLSLALLGGVYLKGRADARVACEKRIAALSAAEIDAKDSDDAVQRETAIRDTIAIRDDIARLRAILARRNANDTASSLCGLAGESDVVFDDHAEIFETGVQPQP